MYSSASARNSRGPLLKSILVLLAVGGYGEGKSPPSAGAATSPQETAELRQITAEVRKRIDRIADQVELETLAQERLDFSGDVAAWAISQAVLTPAQERQEATKVHAAITSKVRSVPTPKPVEELFKKLIGGLPMHDSPREFEWTLIVLEVGEVNAFTAGGGFVYVTKSLLDALLSDAARGPGALAAVLAHEIGHVARGHARRGYQRERIEAEIGDDVERKAQKEQLGKILKTAVNATGVLVKFLYAREQEYEADLFALHLCRNLEVDADHCLDTYRWLVMLQHPKVATDADYVPADAGGRDLGAYFLSSHPPGLRRLRRLRLELAGAFADESSFGLFTWKAGADSPVKAKEAAIGKDERALVLVHGLGGGDKTFVRFREIIAKEAPSVPLLLFRYPNDDSLAHAAAFLKREVTRVVVAPERLVFVGHSAGGLVVRAYAEKFGGRCEHAVFLGTPHRGSNLAGAKFIVDLAGFVPALRKGIPEAVDESIREGEGQIGHDVQPDSLFLRWLGDAPGTAPYHSHAGQYLGKVARTGLMEAFPMARTAAKTLLEAKVRRPAWVREAVLARVDALTLPEELTDGDGVVSVASATAAGPKPKTWPKQHHLSLTGDEAIVQDVAALLK